MKICEQCHAENLDIATFCNQCGSRLPKEPKPAEAVQDEPETSEYQCLYESRKHLYDDSVYAQKYIQTSPHLAVSRVNHILNALSVEYYNSAVYNATYFNKNLFSDTWHEPNSKKPYFEIIGYMKEAGKLTAEMAEKMYAINGARNNLNYNENPTAISPEFAEFSYYEGSTIAEHLCELIENIPEQRFKILENNSRLSRNAQDAKKMLDTGDVRGSIGVCGDILRDLLREAYAAFIRVPFSREIEYKYAIEYFSDYEVISKDAVETVNAIVKERNKEHSGNTTQSIVFAQRAYDQTSRLTAYLFQIIDEAPGKIAQIREKMKPVYDWLWQSIIQSADSLKNHKLCIVEYEAYYKNNLGASWKILLCDDEDRSSTRIYSKSADLTPSAYRFSDYLLEFHPQISFVIHTVKQLHKNDRGDEWLYRFNVKVKISTESLLNEPDIIWKLEEEQKERKRIAEKIKEDNRNEFQNAIRRTLLFLLLILIDLGVLALCVFIISFSIPDYYGLDFLKLHNYISFGDFLPALLLGASGVVMSFVMFHFTGYSFGDEMITGVMVYAGINLVLGLLFVWWHWYAMLFFLFISMFVQRVFVLVICFPEVIDGLRYYKS